MTVAKEEAKKLLDIIPDAATWDDIMYEFYVRKKSKYHSNQPKPVRSYRTKK